MIFYMKIIIKVFYKLVVPFLLIIAMHAQNSKFVISLQYIKKMKGISDCNWTLTQNHLVLKGTLNHLAKLTKRLSCVLSTYLYGAFGFMFLSCHVRVFRVNPHTIVA